MNRRVILVLSFLISFAGVYFLFETDTKEYSLNDFIEMKKESKKKGKKLTFGYPDKALLWYFQQRGKAPENWRDEAKIHIHNNNIKLNKANALSWFQLGPGNIGGRVRAIAVHPTEPDIVYIGAASGGVWKSTDGGSSWNVLKDDMENIVVNSITIDPADPNVVYAGTGEGYYNFDQLRGEGIFKSTDAGVTWERLSASFNENFHYVNKLIFDHTTNVLWAATRKGLFATIDGGESFIPVLVSNLGNNVDCSDVEIAYTSPSTVYASFGIFSQSYIYRGTNSGNNFELNFSDSLYGRIDIATSLSEPAKVYATFMGLESNGIEMIAYTSDNGGNWFEAGLPDNVYSEMENFAGTQGWYNNILSVDPENSSTLYVGGVDLWKSTNGGFSWEQNTNWYPEQGAPQYVHADHHAIAFAPSNPQIVYLGNDGGVYRSDDRGNNWTNINNGLFITQFYYGAVAPSGNAYYGGTQDNGTLASGNGTDWDMILSGDGGATEVDFNNPDIIYMEYVNLTIYKSTNGGTTYQRKMDGIPSNGGFNDGTTDRTIFISPFIMDPNNSNSLIAGTYRVWKTTDGADNWFSISGDLTGDGEGDQGAEISTLAIANGNSDVIYVGCSNGRIQVTTNGGSSWNLRNNSLPSVYCTRIAVKSDDPATAFATFSRYLDGQKVYKTTDYGQSWSNISSNLPNIPVNCIFINPGNSDNIYIGTDLGIFSTNNGGVSWQQDINGLANVSVADLDYRASDNKIFAATHGRGMYYASLSGVTGVNEAVSSLPKEYNLTQNYPNPFNPSTKFTFSIPADEHVNINIYNLNGEKVIELMNDFKTAGTYQVNWNGKNETGLEAASGIYVYTIKAGNYINSKKMLLLK